MKKRYTEKELEQLFSKVVKFVQAKNLKREDINQVMLRNEFGKTKHFFFDYFGGMNKLKDKLEPYFNKEKEFYNRDNIDITEKADSGKQKYFVSAVVSGAKINKDFLEAIHLYCKKEKAKLILLLMRGVKIKDKFNKLEYDRIRPYIHTEKQFNNKLSAYDFKLNPQQILPLTGLERFGQKEKSIIVASPKQMLSSIPRAKKTFPHTIFSTGTISMPEYSNNRQGKLAEQDNLLGGLIIEIVNNKYFNARQVQWKQGRFTDINKSYYKDKVLKENAEAIVLGDLHIGNHDKEALKASKEQILESGANKVYIHDICDFASISHHLEKDHFGKHQRHSFQKTLEKEMDYLCGWVEEWTSDIRDREFIVVKSNHDEWLDRYLTEGKFINDITDNAIFGAKLFIRYLNKQNPLSWYISCGLGLPNLRFLKRDEGSRVLGIECGQHGDKGNNGSRGGNARTSEKSFGSCVDAHSHSPCIFRDAWKVGTNSLLSMYYNKGGGSSWIHSNTLIHANGSRQMITSINGKWRMK